jgi:hypothetical protein
MALDVENVTDFSLERKYRANGIGVYVYPDNPEKCIAWKRLDPQPSSEIDVEIIKLLLEENKKPRKRSPASIDYDCWDQRKPGEPPYSASVHILVAEIKYSDEELRNFRKEVLKLEKTYREKRDEISKKLVWIKPSIKDILGS